MDKIWYAVMRDLEDNDWGYGSCNLDEAKSMTRLLRDNGYTEAYIAVIRENEDPLCIDEIHTI